MLRVSALFRLTLLASIDDATKNGWNLLCMACNVVSSSWNNFCPVTAIHIDHTHTLMFTRLFAQLSRSLVKQPHRFKSLVFGRAQWKEVGRLFISRLINSRKWLLHFGLFKSIFESFYVGFTIVVVGIIIICLEWVCPSLYRTGTNVANFIKKRQTKKSNSMLNKTTWKLRSRITVFPIKHWPSTITAIPTITKITTKYLNCKHWSDSDMLQTCSKFIRTTVDFVLLLICVL